MDEELTHDPVFQIYYYYINFQILLSRVENHSCIRNIWREKENRTLVSLIESKGKRKKRKEMDEGLTRDKIPIYRSYVQNLLLLY